MDEPGDGAAKLAQVPNLNYAKDMAKRVQEINSFEQSLEADLQAQNQQRNSGLNQVESNEISNNSMEEESSGSGNG